MVYKNYISRGDVLMERLTPIGQFRKKMLEYAKEVVDLEDGETPKDWVDTYIDAIKEERNLVTKNGRKYIKEVY